VVAKRTDATAGQGMPEVDLLFPKILPGLGSMGVVRSAIASRIARGTVNLAFCLPVCDGLSTDPNNPTTLSEPRAMKVGTSNSNPVVPDSQQMAWANLPKQSDTSTNTLLESICGGKSGDVCDEELYVTMSDSTPLMQALQNAFLNPEYDKENKKIEDVGGTSQLVWWVVIPIVDQCAVTEQGAANDPKLVVRYVYSRIIAICPKNTHDRCGFGFTSQPALCSNPEYEERVVIDKMACVNCEDKDKLIGPKATLVK
jgi:hypothetical protein